MKDHVVYSDMWIEACLDGDASLLLLALPIPHIAAGSPQYSGKPFSADVSGIGLVEFGFLAPFKGQLIYQAIGSRPRDQDQPQAPLVKLVAEPQLARLLSFPPVAS